MRFIPRLRPLTLVALALLAALPAAASTCADPDPALDLEQRVADCEADLAWVWDRRGYPHLLLNQARALRLLGRGEEALPVLQEALGYAPEDAVYWAEMGRLSLALNDPATAVAMYSQAVTLSPDDPWNRADRAEAWFTFGQPRACIADLAEALPKIEGQTDDAWFRNLNGRCLDAAGRPAEAVAAFESAVRAFPGYLDALGNRVYALVNQGRYDAVLEASSLLLDPAQTPDLTEAWRLSLHALRVDALVYLGRGAEIDAEIAALRAAQGETVEIRNLEAWGLFTAGRLQEAERAAQTLRDLPDDPPRPGYVIDTLAQIDLAMGRVDAALDGLELAAWRDPGLAQSWVPALAKQGYLPQTGLADDILTALRRCIAERGQACDLKPLPVTDAVPVAVSRPVPPPAGGAPAEGPDFVAAPGEAPAQDPATPPPAEPPGLGTAPGAGRPVTP